MFSLQRLLGKEDRFFELLEEGAKQAQSSGAALVRLLDNPQEVKTLEEFVLVMRAEKRVGEEISEALSTSFVTPLEREDISALAVVLHRIPETVVRIAERILSAPHLVEGVKLGRQTADLGRATETVLLMIQELRKGSDLEKIKEQNDALQVIEGRADKVINELLRELYNGNFEPLKVVFLKEVYELLEKVVDQCRNAGNVINQIVLKNS
jgi:uncharacterized protein Yka (UPF0111/DUF47 family)